MWRKLHHHQKFTGNNYMICVNVLMCIQLCTCLQDFQYICICRTLYVVNTDGHRQHQVSILYGLIWHMLYLMLIARICNVAVPLVQHWVISYSPLYAVSYCTQRYYLKLLYLRLYSNKFIILLFWRVLSLLICTCFCWHIIFHSTVCIISRTIYRPNIN